MSQDKNGIDNFGFIPDAKKHDTIADQLQKVQQ
jgi:hypothetical protein